MRVKIADGFEAWHGLYLSKRGFTNDPSKGQTHLVKPLQDEKERLECFVGEMKAVFTKPKNTLSMDELHGLAWQITAYNRKVVAIEKNIAEIKSKVLKPGNKIGDSKKVFASLMKIDRVKKIEIENGAYLKIFTSPLRVHWNEADTDSDGNETTKPMDSLVGRMVIAFNLLERGFLRIYNLDFQVDGHCHPTVGSDHRLCVGTFDKDLAEANNQGDLVRYVTLVMFVLQHPGDKDEGYIHYVSWEKGKEAKTYSSNFRVAPTPVPKADP